VPSEKQRPASRKKHKKCREGCTKEKNHSAFTEKGAHCTRKARREGRQAKSKTGYAGRWFRVFAARFGGRWHFLQAFSWR